MPKYKEKCTATKKNGEPCKSWAMANGFCRRHGGVVGVEPEAKEATATELPVDIEICGTTTAKGTPCKIRAVENGYCRRHQGFSDTAEETVVDPEEKTLASLEIEAAMVDEKLPLENESQEIGHFAKDAFNACRPLSWRPTDTEGDSDVGLDIQVQLVNQSQYKGMFNVQVKGSKQLENDRNKKLSSDQIFYSISLKVSTLNYYARIENPVLLVFADLIQDPDPRKCKVYYLWIDDELEKHLNEHSNLSHLGKDSHTFRIPVTNILNNEVDVLPYLTDRIKKKRALQGIYNVVEQNNPDTLRTLSKLSNCLSSKIVIDSVLTETDNPWVDAPKDSFANDLCNVDKYMKSNQADQAKEALEKLSSLIEEANNHEKSEYFYQKASFLSLIGKEEESLSFFKDAHETSPKIKKYRIAYLEGQLFKHFADKVFCKDIIAEISNETEIEYIRMRALLLAITGEHDEALKILKDQKEKDIIVLKTIIHFLKPDYNECINLCDYALAEHDLTLKQKFILHYLKGKSLFNLGAGKNLTSGSDITIPFSGLPEMDAKILKNAWRVTKSAWDIAYKLGYPRECVEIIESSLILSMYFNDTEFFYKHLQHIATTRPYVNNIQKTLLLVAIQLEDGEIIRKQLSKLPKTPEHIIHQILLDNQENNKSEVVKLLLQHLDDLFKTKAHNLDIALAAAAQCANSIFRNSDRDIFLNKLKLLPNTEGILAGYDFFSTLNENLLNKKNAVEKLYGVFKRGCKEIHLLTQLFWHLDPDEKESAHKLIEVSEAIAVESDFSEREAVILCRAKATLEDWKGVISITDVLIERFGEKPSILAIKAMALDGIGETPGSLKLLEEVVENDRFDSYAFELYAQISARCGLLDKAVCLFTKLLEKAKENKRKTELLRMISALEMSINPESAKLLNICEKYGQYNDRESESEEGIYFILFVGATYSGKGKVTDKQKLIFQQRLKKYGEKFPNSKYFRAGTFNENSSSEEILCCLREMSGITEEMLREYKRYENLMKAGQYPVPFIIRHQFLLNVSDLLYLWELAKNISKDNLQYKLTISHDLYQYNNIEYLSRMTPLLDEISLLVLYDLDLLKYIFSIFPNIAIAKSTIARLQNWGSSLLISPLSYKAKQIAIKLTEYISRIQQPSWGDRNLLDLNYDALEEYKDIIENYDYVFYSDDALARLFLFGKKQNEKTVTTLDVIKKLRKRNIISEKEGAEKIAQLCAWNIGGVPVMYKDDILRVLKGRFQKNEQIPEILEKLQNNNDFCILINYIWHFQKNYIAFLRENGQFIGMMIVSKDKLEVDNNIIAAIWYMWYQKVQFIPKSETNKLGLLARSFWFISNDLVTQIDQQSSFSKYSSRLWSIYNDLVNFVFGDKMDENVYRDSKILVAQFAAKINLPKREKLFQFISSGLTDGTSENDLLNQSYIEAVIKRETKPSVG